MKTFSENESSIRRAFRTLDKDGNGYITARELKEVMSKLGEKLTTKDCTVPAPAVHNPPEVSFQVELSKASCQGCRGHQ